VSCYLPTTRAIAYGTSVADRIDGDDNPLVETPGSDSSQSSITDTTDNADNPLPETPGSDSTQSSTTDTTENEDNPSLGIATGDEHGTHVLGIIGAIEDNDIGIQGINDKAPLWVGRAVGSGAWAESLVEFADASDDSEQPNALRLRLRYFSPWGYSRISSCLYCR